MTRIHPGLMPRHRPPAAPGPPPRGRLLALLTHPRLVIAWRGLFVTLRVGDRELTIDTAHQPYIIDLIRRTM